VLRSRGSLAVSLAPGNERQVYETASIGEIGATIPDQKASETELVAVDGWARPLAGSERRRYDRRSTPTVTKGKTMAEERIRVQLQLKNLKPLAGLDVDCSCMPRRRLEDGSIELTAVVSGETLKKLRRKRQIRVEVLADVAAEAAESAKQVSRINRYADGSLPIARGLRRPGDVA